MDLKTIPMFNYNKEMTKEGRTLFDKIYKQLEPIMKNYLDNNNWYLGASDIASMAAESCFNDLYEKHFM